MSLGHHAELAGEIRLLLRREGLLPKKITWCVFKVWRTAATTAAPRHGEVDVPDLSPMLGESGCTLRLVARSRGQFCPRSGLLNRADPGGLH